MSAFELTGTIIDIMSTQTFNKGFKKREFVIETEAQSYPQKIIFQLIQEKCEMLDSFSVGDTVRVSFDVKGREYNGRYFNALEAWRIFGEKKAAPTAEAEVDIFNDPELFPNANPATVNVPADAEEVEPGQPDDDIPF